MLLHLRVSCCRCEVHIIILMLVTLVIVVRLTHWRRSVYLLTCYIITKEIRWLDLSSNIWVDIWLMLWGEAHWWLGLEIHILLALIAIMHIHLMWNRWWRLMSTSTMNSTLLLLVLRCSLSELENHILISLSLGILLRSCIIYLTCIFLELGWKV